jgi:osmotically-inducible protein OsmY
MKTQSRQATTKKRDGDRRARRSASRVLLLGRGAAGRELTPLIEDSGVKVERKLRIDGGGGEARADLVVLLPPLGRGGLARGCRELRQRQPAPVIVVRSRGAGNAAPLYEAGATAVIDWPGDRHQLLRLLARQLGNQRRPDQEDRRLTRVVRRRLETSGAALRQPLTARVVARTVFLAGEVDALWKKSALPPLAASVPGVEDVVVGGVSVTTELRSDDDIGYAVRALLDGAGGRVVATVAVSVESGVVTLAGTIGDRDELTRLVELVHHVRGARAVRNLVTVAPDEAARSAEVAKRIRRALDSVTPLHAQLRTAVFGGVLVLSGVVRTADERIRIADLAERQAGVDRVVNKLELALPAAS